MNIGSISGTLSGTGETTGFPYQTRVSLELDNTSNQAKKSLALPPVKNITASEFFNQAYSVQHEKLLKSGFSNSADISVVDTCSIYHHPIYNKKVFLHKERGLLFIGKNFVFDDIREIQLNLTTTGEYQRGGLRFQVGDKHYFRSIGAEGKIGVLENPDSDDGSFGSKEELLGYVTQRLKIKLNPIVWN